MSRKNYTHRVRVRVSYDMEIITLAPTEEIAVARVEKALKEQHGKDTVVMLIEETVKC